MQALDYRHQEAMHARVDGIVQDKCMAETLNPWYPGWCKRPCFSYEYLRAFNRPNVTLMDTINSDKGDCQLTPNGLRADGTDYELKDIVLCTGYKLGSSFAVGKRFITGRHEVTLREING